MGSTFGNGKLDRRDAELETLERDPARALYEGRRTLLEQVEGAPVPEPPPVRHQLAKRVVIGTGVGREHAALAENAMGELDRGPKGLGVVRAGGQDGLAQALTS